MSTVRNSSAVVLGLFLSANALAADTCALLSRPDAAAVLGQPVTTVIPAGPERDDDSGGQLSYCTYAASKAAIVLSVVEFATAAEARKQLSANLVKERMDEEDAKVTEEPGIGEKSFWGVSEHGASFTFLKGSRVVSLGLGGAAGAQAAGRKDALRRAALSVAGKL
ncbi:MAG: hypothetical protein ABI661_08030 [Gammaproteobacteria bacterium]